MTSREIKTIIRQLKKRELSIMDVPEEVKHHKDVLDAERKFGLRVECNRGYDVIHEQFFVEEELYYSDMFGETKSCKQRLVFETFAEFYDYLGGKIYEHSCYKYADLAKFEGFIKEKNIDVNRLVENDYLSEETIDGMVCSISDEEVETYNLIDANKKTIKTWIKKFDECTSGAELDAVVDKYEKSKLRGTVDVSFFFYQYIYQDVHSEKRFKAIMEYMCTGRYPGYKMINGLCSIYGPERVLEKYDYNGGARQTNYRYKKRLKSYVELLNSDRIRFRRRRFFDKDTHYYCEETAGYSDSERRPIVTVERYFESFAEFIEHTGGSLVGADLSAEIKLSVDISKYEVDETTKLPVTAVDDLKCKVQKGYSEGKFYVTKKWLTVAGSLVKSENYSTRYFFDFVHFLHGDLSDADLLFCDGLKNVYDFSGVCFDNAKMTSELCDKFGITYDEYKLDMSSIGSFELIEKNEEETSIALAENGGTEVGEVDYEVHGFYLANDQKRNFQKIYYITDLHLLHRLKNAKCKSKSDVQYVLQKIVDNIVYEAKCLLLIGGDVSSDATVFEIFVRLLKKGLDKKRYYNTDVVFVLGNHELWGFSKNTIEEIVAIYRGIIEENGMFLLHNELIYENMGGKLSKVSYESLMAASIKELRELMKSTRLAILGGLGFSGYNQEFNANQGIYRKTLDRAGEIFESKKFEELYAHVLPAIIDKNTVVFTHTPKKDWCSDPELQKDIVYLSGHTHRNEFYDDGDYRLYSDNQVGYRNENPHLKSFLLNNEYDCFSDYADGIYEISSSQYNDFYRGKNIQMDFTREVNILYMLKKKGYYCFIHESKKGLLSILNGGTLKRLDKRDINYYFLHMDEVISYIRGPIDKYMEVMKRVSEEIRRIGGYGTIHGCIVDIDWYNHIYVNPVDLTITGYWALNIVDKIVYPNVPELLKVGCPEIYANYLKLIGEDKENVLMPVKVKNEVGFLPEEYLSTDIYKASREIKKMQKLESNILSSWYENPGHTNEIEKK